MLLWLVKISTQYQLIMPIGHSKAMWQCKWHNLVSNFGTKQCKWRHLMTKFGTNLEQIRMLVFKRNTNLISRNIANLKLRNVRASHSRFSSQTEQTLSTVSSFWFLPGEAGRVHAHPWLQVQVHDHHHLPKWPLLSPGWDSERGGLCAHKGGHVPNLLQPRHHGSGRQLHHVSFTNPCKTAGLLFFNDDKEDAKKNDNNVVKVKGCLIQAHVDINNLPPFPSWPAITRS